MFYTELEVIVCFKADLILNPPGLTAKAIAMATKHGTLLVIMM